MTELLERAITAIKQLPADAQDAIATRWLAEVDDEQAWSARFTATTDAQWNRLADRVRHTIARGDVTPVDEVFPPRATS